MKMKELKTICLLLSIILVLGFSQLDTVIADQMFDSYGNISWKEEQARLGNFAIHLDRNPEAIGYIGYYIGKKDKLKKVKSRAERARDFLISKFNIKASRIIVINAGRNEETRIMLQPVPKDMPPPF
jgi:hypothetical protein